MASLKCLNPNDKLDLMIITDNGIIIKLPLEQVSTLKRATQGVRLINLKDDQKVSTVALVIKEEKNEAESISEESKLLESDNGEIISDSIDKEDK